MNRTRPVDSEDPRHGTGDDGSIDRGRRAFLAAVPATALVVAFTGCSSSSKTPTTTSPATTLVRGSISDSAGAQWPFYGHDLSQTRTNVAETKITKANVSSLATSWSVDDVVGVTGTPAVVDDVAYFTDWKGQAWAVEAATGKKIWTVEIAPGSMFVAAPAVDGDRVYLAVNKELYCVDAKAGKQLWKATTHEHPQAQINASPVVVDGMVIQGTASFENMMNKESYTFRGSIGAWDTKTGKQLWNFFATPADKTSGPGVGIWSTPAIDTKRHLLFVGTGQALAPPSANLGDSCLAIDYRTGKLKWSRQFTYPDVFSNGHPGGKDADLGASPNLWTSDGRDLVGGCDKGGTYHAMDRDSGEEVWKTQLAPGSPFGGAIGSAAFVDGAIIASSNQGDPETNAPRNFSRVYNLDPATGHIRWATDELKGKIFGPVSAVPGIAFVGTDEGHLHAFEVSTGKELWKMDAPDKTACGPSIVAGRIIWGYGFIMFGGPGKGGVIALEPKA